MEFSSADYPMRGMSDPSASLPSAYFIPRALENLLLTATKGCVFPVLEAKVMNPMNEVPNTPQPMSCAGVDFGVTACCSTVQNIGPSSLHATGEYPSMHVLFAVLLISTQMNPSRPPSSPS